MSGKLIIEGNAVYELDEECMLRKRLDQTDEEEKREAEGWVVGKYPKEDTKSKLTERRDTKCDSKEVYVIKERGGEEVPSCKSNTYDEKAEMFQKIKRISIRNRCCIRIHYHNRC